MNPLLIQAIGSILRAGLMALAGYLVNWGIWTNDEAGQYVGAAALALIGLGWSLWQKYRSRLKFLAALQAPVGTDEKDLQVPVGKAGGAAVLVLAALLGGLAAVSGGCAAKVPPGVSLAGKMAYQARNVTDAAGTALGAIELFTDQGLIPKPVAVQVIQVIRQVGVAGNALADALRLYVQTKGADGGIEIRTTIQNVQRLITDALVAVPDLETRKRIQAVTQPILDALAAVLVPLDDRFLPEPSPDFSPAAWTALIDNADAALARLSH